ncbi:Carbonic anhydrase 9, partial [Stegodyphus mimosarum]
MFKRCGGERQSPIDIEPKDLDPNDQLGEFDFENYEDELEDAKIENNGHTIQITPGPSDKLYFTKGGFDDKYMFLQLHFHWGSDSKKGSEHTIDGERFPMEMHLVHMNMNYKTKEQAERKEDGLAVLAVLFEVSNEDNPALEPIIQKLDDVRKEGAKSDIDDLKLISLLPDDLMPYYRYEGSLTTPPCLEVVVWTIFENRVPISEKQLQQFRNVKEEDEHEPEENLVNNYRPVQELNNRKVEISRDEDDDDNDGAIVVPSILLILFALSFFL